MSRRYHGTIKDIHENTWVIELWDGATAASPDASISLKLSGADFEWQGNDKMPFGLRPSSIDVGFSTVWTTTDQPDLNTKTNLSNIALDEEQKWAIKVTKNGSFHWAGRVLADQIHYSFSDIYGWVINIHAVDCLNLIEGYFVDPTWFGISSNTRETAIVLIASILDQTGLIDYFPNDVYADAIQTTNATFPANNIGKTLAYTTVSKNSFIDNFEVNLTSDKIKYLNCREALEQILKPFGASMRLDAGLYWITQPNAYESSSFGYTTYGNNGVLNTYNTTLNHQVTNAYPIRPTWESKPDISYQKPVRAIEIQWDKQNHQSTERLYASWSTSELQFTTSDIETGGTLAGKTIKVVFDIEFNETTGYAGKSFDIQLFSSARSGANYYTWNETTELWDNRGTSKPFHTIHLETVKWKAGKQYYRFEQELGEPPSGYTLDCTVKVDRTIKPTSFSPTTGGSTWSAAGTTAHVFGGKISISQAYGNTDPRFYNYPEKFNFTLDSPRNTNSTKLDYPINYYDATSLKDVGGLMVFNATTYVVPGSWSVSWHSETGTIAAVLGANIAGLYTDFLPTINGTWHDNSNFHAAKSVYFNSSTWIFNGGKFNISSNSWSGEWLKVDTDYTLYNSDGAGERVVQVGTDTIKDKLIQNEKAIADLRALVGVLSKGVIIPDIINNGLNTPTADPAADTIYNLQLNYDSSDIDFSWRVQKTSSSDWIKVMKFTNEDATSDTTITADSELFFVLEANTKYAVRGNISFLMTINTGMKFDFNGPATPTLVSISGQSFNGAHFNTSAFGSVTTLTAASSAGNINFFGTIQNGANAGNFQFRWAQDTSHADTLRVYAGSYLEIMKII